MSKFRYEPVVIAGAVFTAATGAVTALGAGHYLTLDQVSTVTGIIATVAPAVTWFVRTLTRSKASLKDEAAAVSPPQYVGAPAPAPAAASESAPVPPTFSIPPISIPAPRG